TVSTMIVCVNRYPDGNQSFDQARVAAEVLTHPMRDLNDAAHRSLAIPPGRRHVQTVGTRESKFDRRKRDELSVVWRHRPSPATRCNPLAEGRQKTNRFRFRISGVANSIRCARYLVAARP